MEELWNALLDEYETLATLQNITVQNPTDLIVLVAGLAGGILCAIAVSVVLRLRLGRIVDGLLARGAADAASALTPAEGGFAGAWYLAELRCGRMLRKTVCAVLPDLSDGEKPKTELELLAKTRFFLPTEKQDEARRRFSRSRIRPLTTGLAVLAILACAALLLAFLPSILRMCDNVISSIRG